MIDPLETLRLADQAIAKADQLLEDARHDRPPKFTCPDCGGQASKVVNTRGLVSDEAVRRRRECLDCQARWSTVERIVQGSLKKSD